MKIKYIPEDSSHNLRSSEKIINFNMTLTMFYLKILTIFPVKDVLIDAHD